MKGLFHVVLLDGDKAKDSFKHAGEGFKGFVFAAVLACILPLLEFVALFTRAATTCVKGIDTTQPLTPAFS